MGSHSVSSRMISQLSSQQTSCAQEVQNTYPSHRRPPLENKSKQPGSAYGRLRLCLAHVRERTWLLLAHHGSQEDETGREGEQVGMVLAASGRHTTAKRKQECGHSQKRGPPIQHRPQARPARMTICRMTLPRHLATYPGFSARSWRSAGTSKSQSSRRLVLVWRCDRPKPFLGEGG